MAAGWMASAVRLKEQGLSRREIAGQLGKKQGTVNEFFNRYGKLVPEAREACLSGKIGFRLTMALAMLAPGQQEEVLRVVLGGEGIKNEIEALLAEKRVLEREVKRLRASSLFASKLRKLVLALEKEECEVAELASQVDLKDYYLEAQRWIGVFQRYERYVRDALGGKKAVVIDVKTRAGPENF